MASPANMNGPLPFPKHPETLLPVPGQVLPQPGPYIPRGASIDPNHERNRDFGSAPQSYHIQGHNHDHDNSRSGNNSPVAGSASQSQSAGKSQTVFIHKLFDMLEDPSLSHLIWWSPTQDSFCLYPGEEFSNVLAQYFKHTNIASFIRQLNMYGFHKVNDNFQPEDKHHSSSGAGNGSQGSQGSHADNCSGQTTAAQQTRWEFRHSANHFRKGDVESLSLIKRKLSKVTSSHKEIVSLKTLPPTSEAPLEEAKQGRQSPTPEQYHLSIYQQLWNQMAVPGSRNPSTSSGKDLPRQVPTVYAGPAPIMGQYPYPVYAHQMGHPHSPNSPTLGEQPTASPSYFLHLPLHAQPLLQPQLRQTSVQTPAISLDLSINLKLVELTSAVNNLKSAYLDLLARHDSLTAMYHKGQSDLLQLTEIVERLTSKARDNEDLARKEKGSETGETAETGTRGERGKRGETVDRKMANTPVNRVLSPTHDSMSPTTVTQTADLAQFKNHLKGKIKSLADPLPRHASQSQQNYRLDDASGTPTPGRPAVPGGIVPQQYPLNPNYSLYNSADGTLRQSVSGPALGLEDQLKSNLARPAVHRQVSVFVDPLLPAPAPLNLQPPKTPSTPTNLPLPKTIKEEPLASDLSSASGSSVVSAVSGVSSVSGPPQYVQQYQPFAPATHAYYQHMVHDPSLLRTSLLPAMLHPLPQRLVSGTPQRHSLNLIVHYKPEEPETSLASTSRPVTALKEPVVTAKNDELPAGSSKKQLPSMEELNKSLRSGSGGPLFGLHQSSEPEEAAAKRRKLEE